MVGRRINRIWKKNNLDHTGQNPQGNYYENTVCVVAFIQDSKVEHLFIYGCRCRNTRARITKHMTLKMTLRVSDLMHSGRVVFFPTFKAKEACVFLSVRLCVFMVHTVMTVVNVCCTLF